MQDILGRKKKTGFGRSILPPYLKGTVTKDVEEFVRRVCGKQPSGSRRMVNVNEVIDYVKYLDARYPVLRPLPPANALAEDPKTLHDLFEGLKDRHSQFVCAQRQQQKSFQKAFAKRKRRCLVCSFYLMPLLDIHHIVPLAEGGDNRLITVLCPQCYRIVDYLMRLKAKSMQMRLQEYRDWTKRRSSSDWYGQANQNMTDLVDLYLKHWEYVNYETFLREHVQPLAHRYPFACLDFCNIVDQERFPPTQTVSSLPSRD